jgi:hypothetical protein
MVDGFPTPSDSWALRGCGIRGDRRIAGYFSLRQHAQSSATLVRTSARHRPRTRSTREAIAARRRTPSRTRPWRPGARRPSIPWRRRPTPPRGTPSRTHPGSRRSGRCGRSGRPAISPPAVSPRERSRLTRGCWAPTTIHTLSARAPSRGGASSAKTTSNRTLA